MAQTPVTTGSQIPAGASIAGSIPSGADLTSPDDLHDLAAAWRADGRGVAIATVIATWGSSPRPTGSQLLVDDAGRFKGSVSGGCIEGAVIGEAQTVISTGEVKLLDFGVSDEQAWDVGLACGGKVQVFVERVD